MDIKTAIYRFCNYQERSHQEVKDKLYELGSYPEEVGNLLSELIEAGLLNEERFANSFVRGRFRIKLWGRIKIVQHLKQHRISDYLIKKALKQIDPSEYYATAERLAGKKWETLKAERDSYQKRGKVFRYMQQKGYESGMISELIKGIADELED
jgi:regulatory protein